VPCHWSCTAQLLCEVAKNLVQFAPPTTLLEFAQDLEFSHWVERADGPSELAATSRFQPHDLVNYLLGATNRIVESLSDDFAPFRRHPERPPGRLIDNGR
jgi:hypothetical protein